MSTDREKENKVFTNIYEMDVAKSTREEQLQLWKQNKGGNVAAIAKGALQKSNPNIVKISALPANDSGKPGARLRSTLKPLGRNLKDENVKSTIPGRRDPARDVAKGLRAKPKQAIATRLGESRSKSLADVLNAAEDGVASQQSQKRTTLSSRTRAASKASTDPISTLQAELAAKNLEIKQLQDRLSEQVTSTLRMERDLRDRTEDNNKLHIRLDASEDLLREAEQKLLEKESTEEDLRGQVRELQRARTLERDQHKEQVKLLEARVRQGDELEEAESLMLDLQKEITHLQESARKFSAENESLKSAEAEQRTLKEQAQNKHEEITKNFTKQIADLEEKYSAAQEDKENALTKLEDSQRQLQIARDILTKTDPTITIANLETALPELLDKHEARIKALESRVDLQGKELEECCTVLEDLEQRQASIDQVEQSYQEQLILAEDLKSKLVAVEVEMWPLREQLAEATSTADELKAALEETLQENEQLHFAAQLTQTIEPTI
ncbi:hypothetical protein DFS34DRAFT_685634 [Phlyctochytrium arcticum]|nr:hypothetical protein DFS34DRAFT_685634 [Phlyctochytrium arcticum]